MESIMMTEDLIEQRAIMLQKRPQDLQQVREQVLKSWWEAVKQLEKMKKKNCWFQLRAWITSHSTQHKILQNPVGQD